MKLSKIMNHIRLDLMKMLKVFDRIKLEQIKMIVGKLCSKYDRTKMGICLAACIMLIPAAFMLHSGAALQKDMKPVIKEKQAAAPEGPQEEPSGAVQQTTSAVRPGISETSRGGRIDRESVNLLAQVIEGEAANEPYEGKVAVGAVILNRTESGVFPKTIPGVIYDLDAFESVSNGQFQRPVSQDSMNAALDAINGSDPTGGALYFWNPATSSSPWVWSRQVVTQIGRHVFAL